MHSLSNKQLGILAAVLIIIAGIALAFGAHHSFQPETTHPTPVVTRQAPPAPPLTASEMIAAQDPKGFQLLVSYVNTGFEPQNATIKVGDTVRFTNNSTENMWVAAIGTAANPLYPGTSNCSASAFDSCGPLQPGYYWEFTFTQKGTWEFQNNLDKSNTATITVE